MSEPFSSRQVLCGHVSRAIALSSAFLFCNLLIPVSASAAVWVIPGDSSTIQGGINMAGSGDIVIVMPGTYDETPPLLMKAGVVVTGSGPGQSIITTTSADSTTALVIFSGLDSSAVLEGFTIQGKLNNGGAGGAILIENGGGTLRNNLVFENFSGDGGGAALVNTNATCILDGNTFRANFAQFGGGVYIDGGQPVLINNVFDGNTANEGGGIHVKDSILEITGNTIHGNRANNGARLGGGIRVECTGANFPIISNNLITSNSFGTSSGFGSAVHMDSGCASFFFAHNGVWNNAGSPDLDGMTGFDDSLLGLSYTNIPDNPLYVSASGDDFHLKKISQAIDRGLFLFPDFLCMDVFFNDCLFLSTVPDADFDGIPRPQAGPFPPEVQNLRFQDQDLLVWDSLAISFAAYNVYQGSLSDPAAGLWGSCETGTDIMFGTSFDTQFDTVADIPAAGEGFIYLVTGEDHVSCALDMGAFEANGESTLGAGTDGVKRPNTQACLIPCSDYL